MEFVQLLIALVLVTAQFAVPLRFALCIPVFVAAHIPLISVFLSSVTVIRLVMLACLVRAFMNRDRLGVEMHALDRWVVVWGSILVLTAVGHEVTSDGNPLITRLGLVFDYGGVYYCARLFLRTRNDVVRYAKCLAIIFAPLALFMLIDKLTGVNPYSYVGATFRMVRDGQLRVAGPFANAILAGTIGGVSAPLMLMLFNVRRSLCWIGLVACFLIVYGSTSSGPYMTLMFGLACWVLWKYQFAVFWLKWGVVACLGLLHIVMNDPVWYLIARFDITGGSVAFHRAELISQAIGNFNEWWLTGTDYTRHWIPYGVDWSQRHADITNYFIKMGVLGGVWLFICFVMIFIVAFRAVRKALRHEGGRGEHAYVVWCMGSALAANCFAFLGVSPYDQSYVFLFGVLGAIPGLARESLSRQAGPAVEMSISSFPSYVSRRATGPVSKLQ